MHLGLVPRHLLCQKSTVQSSVADVHDTLDNHKPADARLQDIRVQPANCLSGPALSDGAELCPVMAWVLFSVKGVSTEGTCKARVVQAKGLHQQDHCRWIC